MTKVTKQRAALTEPAVEQPAETVPMGGHVGMVEEIGRAVHAALVRGDHVAHAALSELHVAAGLLRAKAATRAHELAGADRELAEKLRTLL